jgi:hypothetical protein
MRTISEKLRSLAKYPVVDDWSQANFEASEIAFQWLNHRRDTEFGEEDFWNMTDEEWGMFLYFISYALETE